MVMVMVTAIAIAQRRSQREEIRREKRRMLKKETVKLQGGTQCEEIQEGQQQQERQKFKKVQTN